MKYFTLICALISVMLFSIYQSMKLLKFNFLNPIRSHSINHLYFLCIHILMNSKLTGYNIVLGKIYFLCTAEFQTSLILISAGFALLHKFTSLYLLHCISNFLFPYSPRFQHWEQTKLCIELQLKVWPNNKYFEF